MARHGLGQKGINKIFGDLNRNKETDEQLPAQNLKEGQKPGAFSSAGETEGEESRKTLVRERESRGASSEGGTEYSEGETEQLIRLSRIQPNLNQPRKDFSEEKLQELADSIRQFGVIQPLVLKKQGPFYEIIAGERRYRAAKLAGLREVPAILRDYDEKTAREISIIENIQRSDLNAVEEALAYESLIQEYGMTQEEVADRVAKKRSTITNSLRLLRLSPSILQKLREGSLSQGHARALLSVEDEALREELSERCIREGLSVREAEAAVKKLQTAEAVVRKQKTDRKTELFYQSMEKQMEGSLKTKVRILPGRKDRGKLVIEYYSKEDLDRLYLLLKHSKEK